MHTHTKPTYPHHPPQYGELWTDLYVVFRSML